ncbi:MAG: glycoside hydrolase family 16 protein [Lentisphaerae bacterium]|jgi:beta-glucanase (GH16 family)|nr:glycoside hydrolase family 16 protein [Lentisphaerota bacterium]
MKQTAVLKDHADSLLPAGKNWQLVWNDEFDGTELDSSKWNFRLNFWGKPFKAFTDEGVVLDGKSHLQLHLIKKDGYFCSPHLQTGSLTFDMPREESWSFWPFGKKQEAKFMHRYGYYEIRCRLPKNGGWWSAFWLQSPCIGAHPDPRRAGVECDIMESYRMYKDKRLVGGNLWGGYGAEGRGHGHFSWPFVETPDTWHHYGVHWHPNGYVFYADGQEVCRVSPDPKEARIVLDDEGKNAGLAGAVVTGPVSEVEQFILVSTECIGYRKTGKHDPSLEDAILPDFFEVDFVRVFDEVP